MEVSGQKQGEAWWDDQAASSDWAWTPDARSSSQTRGWGLGMIRTRRPLGEELGQRCLHNSLKDPRMGAGGGGE